MIVFLVSRAFLFVLARFAPDLLTPLHRNSTYLPRTDPLAQVWDWTSPWFRFDARWYVDVAEHGYHYGSGGSFNTNFLPLYPLLIRAVQPLALGSAWFAAWLLANAAHPEAAGIRDWLALREQEYFGVYRGVLGLAYLVLARPLT